MHLRAIVGHAPDEDAFPAPPGVPASARACRPGVAVSALDVALSDDGAVRAEALAADAGVTVELWALVSVEASRALAAATQALGIADEAGLRRALGLVAVEPVEVPLAARRSELVGYARELRAASPRRPQGAVPATLGLSVPTHMLLAWRVAAERAGVPAQSWAAEAVGGAVGLPVAWEAASCEAGLSLGEWVAVQAARWSSRRSAAAQI